tara:strand:+ start:12415 stop:12972 length:558 start_codon:yes stop_codon:yes gene_type:complete
MSDENRSVAAKPPRRWLGPALLASVALNLFLVALISVPLFSQSRDGFGVRRHGSMHAMFHESFKDLPKQDRAAIREAMVSHFPKIRPYLVAMRDAKTRLADALAADPYNEETVRAAFADLDKAMSGMGAVGRNAMMAGFAQMTPDQRKHVAKAMREPHGKDLRLGHDRGDHDDGPDREDDMPPPE